ncbi:MAG: hypothetical protein MT334_02675 [Candidatus Nitrosopumilus limneticus]|nr:hypothetical protein [Candidatus Nitrosopumilus limneticus]MDC4212496.1 hypothetical protein [Candidatus Nitrosopumilus limneticus]MDC4213514.1 hypothetical protein [Candidatus Nitrosopumilus limneticus]MDC4215837.1 hypothetical protein [Candidatus Nitrosopumilus limneticus]MDC4216771.1 hypothetical protein [Candidatus Nitrosopumilus limneticus]
MTKPELEKKIFLHLTKVKFSTHDEMKKLFKCTDKDLTNIISKNSKTASDPLGFILVNKDNTPHRYSLEPTNYDTIHMQVNNYLKGINGILTLCYRNLSVQSTLFENNSGTTSLNKKGIDILDNISLILDRIQQLSFLITYYKSINKIPKNMISLANEDHTKCINMYCKIIKKLQNIVNKEKSQQQAIDLYLFKHQFVVNHLTSII